MVLISYNVLNLSVLKQNIFFLEKLKKNSSSQQKFIYNKSDALCKKSYKIFSKD